MLSVSFVAYLNVPTLRVWLLDRVVAYGGNRTGVGANHAALVAEEVPVSSLAGLSRVSLHGETNVHATGGNRRVDEEIAALGGCCGDRFRQNVIDQAGLG